MQKQEKEKQTGASMPIRFRAWDEDKRTFYFYDFLSTDDVERFGSGEWKYLEHLMQYTGLKDKNGKEIYDGDIVTFVDRPYLVHWDRFAWFIGPQFIDATGQAHEVIGNIYEHPELLPS